MANSIIHSVMPGWNGSESIVAYSIRMREERKARQARLRLARQIALIILTPAMMAGVIELTTILFNYFSIPY